MVSGLRRSSIAIACAPLALLTGCPQQQAANPSSAPPNATAPAIVGVASTQAPEPTPAAPPTPAPTTAQSVEIAARAYKVQQLVNQAEGTYRTGVANYRAGHLEAARQDFDSAVDLLLSSGLDIKADSQLSDEFDQLLDKINSLEIAALKQGNGFSAPLEAAPLDAADQVTFPVDAALTAKVVAELKTTQSDFPLVVNDYVAGFINYFSNSPAGHAHLMRSLERAGKYKDMISKVLAEEGVPQDLIYLAVAESGFQPQALNARSGAGGMWQFMPTGAYGLARNGWVDERFDPEKSSRAYAHYIKSLYNQFGDWYLAMAAYDWGPGYVQRSVMRTGYADYWELYRRNALPQETKNYVPGIIAAIIMAKNPKQYGLDALVPDEPMVSDTVTVSYAVDLRLVADVTASSLPEIVGLNPSLLRMTTPGDRDFDLHLPVGTHDLYLTRIKQIPEDKRASWRFHVVRPGESLDAIASNLHARPSEIASANGIASTAVLETGDELVVPVTVAAAVAHPLRYVTRAGDTLINVADRFNVSVSDLKQWNHLSSSVIGPHRTLDVSEPVHLAPVTHVRARAASSGAAHTTATQGSASTKGNAPSVKTAAAKTDATRSAARPAVRPAATPAVKAAAKPVAKAPASPAKRVPAATAAKKAAATPSMK
jgi:membrane-bound lytic murein transglycosylase D